MVEARDNLHELLKALEEIRAKDYPDVPKEMIEEIAMAQYNNQDDRAKARSETMKVVAKHVNALIKEVDADVACQ